MKIVRVTANFAEKLGPKNKEKKFYALSEVLTRGNLKLSVSKHERENVAGAQINQKRVEYKLSGRDDDDKRGEGIKDAGSKKSSRKKRSTGTGVRVKLCFTVISRPISRFTSSPSSSFFYTRITST